MSSVNNTDNKQNNRVDAPIVFFLLFVVLYLFTSFFLSRVAQSTGSISFFGNNVPIPSFTGVLSSIGNMCLIFMVVFYKRPGFFTALIFLLTQFPILVIQVFVRHGATSISGFFTNILTLIAIILIYNRNKTIEEYQTLEVDSLRKQHRFSKRLFEQTATALVNAIDAKDAYSHGHSLRVAEYSKRIAEIMGKDEDECYKIYYAALLHDVGKIGTPGSIINKKGKLTKEEYNVVKQHTVIGNQILSSINEYPYLSIGAHYHHERYDGKGYPEHLKGDDIPEIARIISVADAYDAMTSNRSYRDAIPQQLVREEIVKCSGTQFDPKIAKMMQHLIDLDAAYQMRERDVVNELAGKNELICGEFRNEISDGIKIGSHIKSIHMRLMSDEYDKVNGRGPAIVLFDSLDGRVHMDEKTAEELNYYEYCEIWLDGVINNKGARKIQINTIIEEPERYGVDKSRKNIAYDIEAVKYKDHLQIKIFDGKETNIITIALPDNSRFAYLALTGESCHIYDVSISKSPLAITDSYIKRIADEISFIDKNEGDIKNVQVDGYRTASSEGVLIVDGMELSFHAMSLPTARLIWHCAFLVIFSSEDGMINGKNYKEYALIRLDGENWESGGYAVNKLIVNKQESFDGWDVWKEKNKEGIDCVASFTLKDDTIVLVTENLGVFIKNITQLTDDCKDVYVALTGDQCAITDIKIKVK